MSDDALVAVEPTALATMTNPPEAVLMEARRAALALADVIKSKPNPVVMNGEQYLEFEDWTTLGRFYGITAGEEAPPEFVEFGPVRGFVATAVALFDGRVLSRATAYCLSDEEKWGTRPRYEWVYLRRSGGTSVEDPGKDEIVWEDNPRRPGGKRPAKQRVRAGEESVPLFQLASMAQTRANAKVLRNVLSWVAVLAGYRPTPAEEMEAVGAVRVAVEEPKPEKATKGKGKAAKRGREPGEDDRETHPGSGCPFCGSAEIVTDSKGETAVCSDCNKGWNLGR